MIQLIWFIQLLILAYKDDTSIVFFQEVGHSIHIIDAYSNRNQALPHYIDLLKSKPMFMEITMHHLILKLLSLPVVVVEER